MSRILLLGAGFVTGPLVDYLYKRGHQLTIASQFLHEAQNLANSRDGIIAKAVDVTDKSAVRQLVAGSDLVVSFVPYQFHVEVAKVCLEEGKHLVTASYTHPDMMALDAQAKAAGLTFLNEIGVDPGIDHMTAKQVIDEAHENGEEVEALVSWCGGIPAPDANDNPLGYKFSWSPMAVLLAVGNEAKYLRDGIEETISAAQLLPSMRDVELANDFQLRGYANRDSTLYKQQYAIPEVKTLLRGTLRYPGFGPVMQAAKDLGLLSNDPFVPEPPSSWKHWFRTQVKRRDIEQLTEGSELWQAFSWLGCLEDTPMQGRSPIEAFCRLLQERLSYKEGERDMIAMQHRFVVKAKNGEKRYIKSTLIEKGEPDGFSAMAKTVGLPAAIAADLILSNVITRRGVCIPVTPDIYKPILEQLRRLNIMMDEQEVAVADEKAFLNNL